MESVQTEVICATDAEDADQQVAEAKACGKYCLVTTSGDNYIGVFVA